MSKKIIFIKFFFTLLIFIFTYFYYTYANKFLIVSDNIYYSKSVLFDIFFISLTFILINFYFSLHSFFILAFLFILNYLTGTNTILNVLFILVFCLVFRFLLKDKFQRFFFVIIYSFSLILFINLVYVDTKDIKLESYRAADIWLNSPEKDYVIELKNTYGDLIKYVKKKDVEDYKQYRNQIFYVDSNGFRNKEINYQPDFILLGDSFVAGNGNEKDISYYMNSILGISAYNLGYPGNLNNYINNYNLIKNNFSKTNLILFIFEGNDFKDASLTYFKYGDLIQNSILSYISNKIQFFKKSIYFNQLIDSLIYKKVETHIFGDQKYLHYKDYLKVSTSSNPKLIFDETNENNNLFAKNKDLKKIVYIPSKISILINLSDKNNLKEKLQLSKQKKLASINSLFKDIEVIDLSKTFINYSLERNKLPYWKDDSHWDENGIRMAVLEISKRLK